MATFPLSSILLLLAVGPVAGQTGAIRRLTLDSLRDKIAGGWAGQMIGVSYGAPTEFKSNGHINESELNRWTPDRVSNGRSSTPIAAISTAP